MSIPRTEITNGAHANGGTGLYSSIKGSKKPLANLFNPMNNPNGTPTIIPATNPRNTLKNESHMWPVGIGILNKLKSPVTKLKTLLLKFGLTSPCSLWTGYSPGKISANQSGIKKPMILLTSIISYQINGICL